MNNLFKLFIVYLFSALEVAADLNKEEKILATNYANYLISNTELHTFDGRVFYMEGNPDLQTLGLWKHDVDYLPGAAIFVEIYDYNQDGFLDVALSSDISRNLTQLWLGKETGYYQYAKGIKLGNEILDFGNTKAIKHQYKINGSESVNSYLWLGKQAKFSVLNSWDGVKVKWGDRNEEILDNLKKYLNGDIHGHQFKPEIWVVWIFDLIDTKKGNVNWVKYKHSEGRFGLGKIVDEMIASYDPKELTLKSLRQRLIASKGDSGYGEERNIYDGSPKNGIEQKNSEVINNQIPSQKKPQDQEVDGKSSFLWIIGGFLLLVIAVVIFRLVLPH